MSVNRMWFMIYANKHLLCKEFFSGLKTKKTASKDRMAARYDSPIPHMSFKVHVNVDLSKSA